MTAIVSGCCTHKPRAAAPRISVKGKMGHRMSYQESEMARVPDRIHVYKVNRNPSNQDESMQEAGNYYHIEQSAYWNRFVPGTRVTVFCLTWGLWLTYMLRYPQRWEAVVDRQHQLLRSYGFSISWVQRLEKGGTLKVIGPSPTRRKIHKKRTLLV
jgi:hypothetical protein